MKITFSDIHVPTNGMCAVFVKQDGKFSTAANHVNEATGGAIEKILKSQRFDGKFGQMQEMPAPANLDLDSVILVGIGKEDKLTEHKLKQIGGGLVARFKGNGIAELTIAGGDLDPESLAHIAAGAMLRAYDFDKYRTKVKADKKPSLKAIDITSANPKASKAAWSSIQKVMDGVYMARDLVTEPGNIIHPESFAKEIETLAKLGIEVEILGEKEMTKLGMGALLGVGQGSVFESKLAIMRWNGAKKADEAPVALVGKGVTFDTGGISLKPGPGMEEMKFDMGGAAIVVGAMKAIAGRKAKANVVGLVGLVENMPSGNAQRPGDVVTSMSGQTIEVLNTDAEGRLVLADVLWYAQDRFKPQYMVDFATLTGAMIISLGNDQYAGLFSNDDKLSTMLTDAGLASGDKVWRMPLSDEYDALINSPIADMKNIGGRAAGSITAAQFLQRFVNKTKWAHIDVAGTVWSSRSTKTWAKGATGYGVQLVNQFIADNFEK